MGLESLVGNSNQLFPVGGGNQISTQGLITGPAKGPGGPQADQLLEYVGPGGGFMGKPFIPPTAISGPGTITDPKLFPELFPPNFLDQVGPLQTAEPNYSSQFDKFGEQLTGFGDQMTGYQDALGSFNEQIGGMGKQFETITNRLDSVDKGLGSLGNQIASFENMQKAQPQQVMPQQQQQSYNPFGFGGFGGFGGLGSLFGRRY